MNSLVNLRAVCHHAVSIINKHDKENGTDYLLTLETYLLNNKSLQEAANRLFVHKSTISYRLRCIGELVKIDYDDPMERLSVLISCIITRRFNEAESLKQ